MWKQVILKRDCELSWPTPDQITGTSGFSSVAEGQSAAEWRYYV